MGATRHENWAGGRTNAHFPVNVCAGSDRSFSQSSWRTDLRRGCRDCALREHPGRRNIVRNSQFEIHKATEFKTPADIADIDARGKNSIRQIYGPWIRPLVAPQNNAAGNEGQIVRTAIDIDHGIAAGTGWIVAGNRRRVVRADHGRNAMYRG